MTCLTLLTFLPVLQQGGAHSDEAVSLNNSHGGLPSAGSTSSTELNHQVEVFRGMRQCNHPMTWLRDNDVGTAQLMSNVSLPAGLSSALAGQVPATLELKIEKQDKDEMQDDLSGEEKSDDESDRRDMRTPRAGTRTR